MHSCPARPSNHAQPEPKRPMPAAANFSETPAKDPNVELIAAARFPLGSPPPPFFIHVQNSEWFQWPPPLLRTALRIFSGTASRPFSRSSMDLAWRSAWPSRALLRLET